MYIYSVFNSRKMYRKKNNEFIQWKLSINRKPLIVLVARQVGKTWLINQS